MMGFTVSVERPALALVYAVDVTTTRGLTTTNTATTTASTNASTARAINPAL